MLQKQKIGPRTMASALLDLMIGRIVDGMASKIGNVSQEDVAMIHPFKIQYGVSILLEIRKNVQKQNFNVSMAKSVLINKMFATGILIAKTDQTRFNVVGQDGHNGVNVQIRVVKD